LKKWVWLLLASLLTACHAPPPQQHTQPTGPDVLPAATPSPTQTPAAAPATQPEATREPEPVIISEWEETLSQMTIREKIGQLFIYRLPGGAKTVNTAVRQLTEELHPGGFILFGENVESIDQVHSLTEGLQTLSKILLFIAIDEEGGRVSRIGKLYEEKIPPALQIGETGDPQNVYDAYVTIGERLHSLGVNMNYAPVADIWSNEANTVIGNRAFGRNAEIAANMVEAAVKGLKDTGVLSVVKHFPGHGDTAEDSHFHIAMYNHDRTRFDAMEAIPFLRGIHAGTDGVMVGHIATPLLKKENPIAEWMGPLFESGRLPATFSDYWLTDVLRGEMGFDGLIITDALEMGALTAHFTQEQIAVGAFLAGSDILLIPTDPKTAFAAILNAYESGIITEERLDASVKRILQAKHRLR
jgi:beta-N-acetylhexosaminidase